ncbi:hypothetical protein ACFL6M_04810 [Candidatus Eisenbacteria bacterium]|uniref:Uncharacterized protein n=1 Tax=Eiseniibacteriota bacterium TaxID=2212470 RepID=A0ABV6YKP8_UNCEI
MPSATINCRWGFRDEQDDVEYASVRFHDHGGTGESLRFPFVYDALRLFLGDSKAPLVLGVRSASLVRLYAQFQNVLSSIRTIQTKRLGKLLE